MSYFYEEDDEEDEVNPTEEQQEQGQSGSSRSTKDTIDDLKKAREQMQQHQNSGSNSSNTPGGNTNTGGQGGSSMPNGTSGGGPTGGGGVPSPGAGGTPMPGSATPGATGTPGMAGTGATGAGATGAGTTGAGATGAGATAAGGTAAGGAAAGGTAAGGAAAGGAAAGGAAAGGAAAAGGTAAATAGVAAGAAVAWPILLIILIIVIIIIIIICVIGIIIFIQTMPGAALEKITSLARKAGNAFTSWWGVDSTTQVSDQDIYDVMDYLEEMGYDLKGYGFLTDYIGDEDDAEDDGVKRHEDGDNEGKISEAASIFINQYIISDNYLYTIANDNVSTGTGTGNIFQSAWGAIKAVGSHISRLWSDKMGAREGMLHLYHDSGTIGERGDVYKASERGYIKADADKQTLTIKKGWTNNPMEYSLDGWTGRYGMPLEFLLSIHMATMMPDLAYDMATTFEPKIIILLHTQNGRSSSWML